jgi:hypothetical protein
VFSGYDGAVPRRSTLALGSEAYMKLASALIVALSVAVSSIAARAAEHPSVLPGQDFSNPMFAMKSPNSPGWSGVVQNTSRIAFARSGTSANDSDVAAVFLFPVPSAATDEEFLSQTTKGIENDAPKPRFDVQSSSIQQTSERPYVCIRYSAKAIDHGAKSLIPKKPLELQMSSLYCRYPGRPGVGFAISFSHRGETQLATFEQEAAEFIVGIQVASSAKTP